MVKIFFFGKTRFKSYLTINQSQKLKLIFFHIFLTASGEGGGGPTQVVSLTAFSQFFFLTASLNVCVIVIVYAVVFLLVRLCFLTTLMSQFHFNLFKRGASKKKSVNVGIFWNLEMRLRENLCFRQYLDRWGGVEVGLAKDHTFQMRQHLLP